MKIITLNKRVLDPKKVLKKYAHPDDGKILMNEDFLLQEEGKNLVLVKTLPEDKESVIWRALEGIKYNKTARTDGLITTSRIFGNSQRIPLRNDYCSQCLLHKEFPSQANIISSMVTVLEPIYQEFFPDVYQKHREWVNQHVLPEYRMWGSVFTQGIINQDNRLAYHRDNGNVPGSYSMMLVYQRHLAGGELVIPEYDLSIGARNNILVIFSGQSLIHGVTPILKTAGGGRRYSIVFYSLKAMKNCLTQAEEIKRVQMVKTEKAKKRVQK